MRDIAKLPANEFSKRFTKIATKFTLDTLTFQSFCKAAHLNFPKLVEQAMTVSDRKQLAQGARDELAPKPAVEKLQPDKQAQGENPAPSATATGPSPVPVAVPQAQPDAKAPGEQQEKNPSASTEVPATQLPVAPERGAVASSATCLCYCHNRIGNARNSCSYTRKR